MIHPHIFTGRDGRTVDELLKEFDQQEVSDKSPALCIEIARRLEALQPFDDFADSHDALVVLAKHDMLDAQDLDKVLTTYFSTEKE